MRGKDAGEPSVHLKRRVRDVCSGLDTNVHYPQRALASRTSVEEKCLMIDRVVALPVSDHVWDPHYVELSVLCRARYLPSLALFPLRPSNILVQRITKSTSPSKPTIPQVITDRTRIDSPTTTEHRRNGKGEETITYQVPRYSTPAADSSRSQRRMWMRPERWFPESPGCSQGVLVVCSGTWCAGYGEVLIRLRY